MSNKNLALNFTIFPDFPYFSRISSHIEIEGKKFLIVPINEDFLTFGQMAKGSLAFLLVPDDNSAFANHAKKVISKGKEDAFFEDNNLFSLPLECLKLKPELLFANYEGLSGRGLIVKDTSQVKFLESNEPTPTKLTFKVEKVSKKGLDELCPEASYGGIKAGLYGYELEIEPLSLGIERLPSITRIIFPLFDKTDDGKEPMKNFKKKYEKLVSGATNKELSIEIKKWNFDGDDGYYFLDIHNDNWFGEITVNQGSNNPDENNDRRDNNDSTISQLKTNFKQNITKLLADNNLKTADLDSKFANWETELEKLTSETKIKDYQNEIQQSIQDHNKKQSPKSSGDNGLSLPTKIAIGGVILVVLGLAATIWHLSKKKLQ